MTALSFLFFLCGSVEAIETGPAAAEHWQALTRIDVEAAYNLLQDNHPGAVPEVGDALFRSALAAAHAKALTRVAKVTSYEGYVATLGEFAGAMGDGHIWSYPLFAPRTFEWAGLIAAKRGARWVVTSDDPAVAGAEVAGAQIVSCDGRATDDLAREVLQFRATTSVEALQIRQPWWLLLDDGNPFLTRPSSCVFEDGRQVRTLALSWRKINRDVLRDRYWKHPNGKAGDGVRRSGAGFWIAIEELSPTAQPVIDAVRNQSNNIRAAPYAVVDLRGNGGGDDDYGRVLAEELYGRQYVLSILGPRSGETGGCRPVFRASSANIDATSALALDFQRTGDAEGAAEYTDAVRRMKAATIAGRALTGGPTCPAKTSVASGRTASLMHGRVFVLTDAVCFSSCILTVGYFRKFGAIQVGQTTGADTHYSEVREVVLPSGLSTFSTLMAFMSDWPRNIGPYLPKYEYDADLTDTAALEKWIADMVIRRPLPTGR